MRVSSATAVAKAADAAEDASIGRLNCLQYSRSLQLMLKGLYMVGITRCFLVPVLTGSHA